MSPELSTSVSAKGLFGIKPTAGSFGSRALSGAASAIASAATRSAISGDSFGDSLRLQLPSLIGQLAGTALGEQFDGRSGGETGSQPARKSSGLFGAIEEALALPGRVAGTVGRTVADVVADVGDAVGDVFKGGGNDFSDVASLPGGSLSPSQLAPSSGYLGQKSLGGMKLSDFPVGLMDGAAILADLASELNPIGVAQAQEVGPTVEEVFDRTFGTVQKRAVPQLTPVEENQATITVTAPKKGTAAWDRIVGGGILSRKTAVRYNGFHVSDERVRSALDEMSHLTGKVVNVRSGDRNFVPKGGGKEKFPLERKGC